jgi:hypothetical protein
VTTGGRPSRAPIQNDRLAPGSERAQIAPDPFEMDDEQASDMARALCLLAARSESSHLEGQLPPDEPTAILIFWHRDRDRQPRGDDQ